jgi:hypothetical protein
VCATSIRRYGASVISMCAVSHIKWPLVLTRLNPPTSTSPSSDAPMFYLPQGKNMSSTTPRADLVKCFWAIDSRS